MQSNKIKRRINAVILAFVTVALGMAIVTGANAKGKATDKNVNETVYAGAAKVLDLDTTPTDAEIEEIVKNNAWKAEGAIVMANVTNSANVRAEADENSDKVGYLYNDCGGYIVEYTDEWTKIKSGNMVGWVKNDYLFYGDEAMEKANDVGCYHATVNADTVRVRKSDSVDSDVLGLVANGEVLDVVEETDDWIVVDFEGDTGYISGDLADVEFKIDAGETVDEVKKREAAEKAAEREATRNQFYGAYASSASEVELLAALIHCEAGNQPHEGKVAVGAVVMNRVRSGAYPNTIYGVIYASGQFSPAGSGAVDRRIAAGVDADCIAAAQEALSGVSPVGAACHFRPTGKHDGIVIGGHVFW